MRPLKGQKKPWGAILLFLTPALVLYLAFVLYPVFRTFYNSVHILRMDQSMAQEFVGLKHFQELLHKDRVFPRAVQHSLSWAFVAPMLELSLAFTLAYLLYTRIPGWRFFRTAWFAPMLLSGVVVGVLWKWIYNYDWGVVNTVLRTLGLGALATDWLGHFGTALPALMVVTTWMFTGFNMVIILAAMHSIPEELFDAAQVDGANNLQTVRHVLLPLLQRTLVNLAILSFIGKMKQFEIVWVMTRGGPMWRTETVATYVIKRAFEWRTLDLGYPSAIAVLWFLVIFVLTLLCTRYLQRREILEF
jgi:ABC-type sugar transport system permease subunit